jgi:hypothetical protein
LQLGESPPMGSSVVASVELAGLAIFLSTLRGISWLLIAVCDHGIRELWHVP